MNSIMDFVSGLLATNAESFSLLQILAALGLAYFGGVLSSLTPCVYPMIPITMSVIGGMGPHRRSWRDVALRGGFYVAGMMVSYSFLGVLAGLTGRVFGTFTNSSGWYLGLGIVMTFAALVMVEALPFDPAVWWHTFKRKAHPYWPFSVFFRHIHYATPFEKKEMTLLGAFTLGASSGFIAAPCTTPVLTAILAFIAKTKSVGFGFFLMLFFSLGMGTLLLVVAAFAGALQVLPRSGNWLKTVKIASGLILLAFADYLFFKAGGA